MTLAEVTKLDENGARQYLEGIRWANGRTCPHCNSDRSFELKGKSTRAGLYKCSKCRKPFTVTVGTIFHGSHIGVREWVIAFHLMCASKKGISALQLQRQLGLRQYKSAWHLAHRVRHAMTEGPLAEMLGGVVSVDETWVGGKTKGMGRRYTGNKTPVVALVEHGGRVRTRVVADVTAKTLHTAIRETVKPASAIVTDDLPSYQGIGKHFAAGHHTVNHSAKEYSRKGVTTNSAEAFFALLKRGVYGSFHHVSRKHLSRYAEEFAFRWNRRKLNDGERAAAALAMSGGKRLQYR